MPQKTNPRTHNLFPNGRRPREEFQVVNERERAASEAKTAKLRALRLAREEADRIARLEFEAADPAPGARRKGKPA